MTRGGVGSPGRIKPRLKRASPETLGSRDVASDSNGTECSRSSVTTSPSGSSPGLTTMWSKMCSRSVSRTSPWSTTGVASWSHQESRPCLASGPVLPAGVLDVPWMRSRAVRMASAPSRDIATHVPRLRPAVGAGVPHVRRNATKKDKSRHLTGARALLQGLSRQPGTAVVCAAAEPVMKPLLQRREGTLNSGP